MKNNQLLIFTAVIPALFTFSLSSCKNFQTAEQNSAATGALIGAGAGALLSDDPVKGAALGGAIGGGSGYVYEKSKR